MTTANRRGIFRADTTKIRVGAFRAVEHHWLKVAQGHLVHDTSKNTENWEISRKSANVREIRGEFVDLIAKSEAEFRWFARDEIRSATIFQDEAIVGKC